MTLRLLLFGPPQLQVGAQCQALPLARHNQLIVWLALRGRWIGRAEAAALLWPEHDSRLAYANLRKALFRMSALPHAQPVQQEGGALRVEMDSDVADFESALRDQRLTDALALGTAPLLHGWDDDGNEAWTQWLRFERARLRDAWRAAALARLAQEIDAAEGIALATRLAEEDPLDEAAMQALLQWLARGGQTARAQQTWQQFRQRLADELAVEPSSELVALQAQLGRAGAARTLAAAPAPEVATPSPIDGGFVGRNVELRQIGERLTDPACRLLTLLGPGGIGKTRLARGAVAEFGGRFNDGVSWLALEDATRAGQVGQRLAQALGVRLNGAQPMLDQLVRALQAQRRLVVMDNVEQLAALAPQLEPLLAACPGLTVLATSRVRMGLACEHLLPLAGLPCPEPEDADEVELFDAARLFIQAARRVEPALNPAADALAIVDICRSVQGLPLALELAAAWTRVLSCTEIAAELHRSLDLLRSSDPARPARQASVEAVFDHSWTLLGAAEQQALARLSVFRGGFGPEAARAVAGAAPPTLASLVDKSLLRKEGDRLHLHPLVQQLAGLRLATSETVTATEDAHALHFLRALAQRRRAVTDGNRDALNELDPDWDNVAAAWRRSAAVGANEALDQALAALRDWVDHRGRWREGLDLLHHTAAEPQVDAGVRAHMNAIGAHLAYRLDRFDDAAQRAEAVLAGPPHPGATQQALLVLGGCALRRNRLADAQRHYRAVLRLKPERIDPRNAGGMFGNLSLVEKSLGRYDEAYRLGLAALARFRQLGDHGNVALCLNNLGDLHLVRGEHAAAAPYLRESFELAERHGLIGVRLLAETNLVEVALVEGDLAAAQRHCARALDAARSGGHDAVVGQLLLNRAQLAIRRQQWTAARDDLQQAVRVGLALGHAALAASTLAVFAELLAAGGHAAAAAAVLEFGARQSEFSPAGRELLTRHRRALPLHDDTPAAWPGLGVPELLSRIDAETPSAYGSLLTDLAGR